MNVYSLALALDPTGMTRGAEVSNSALKGVGSTAKTVQSEVRAGFDVLSGSVARLGSDLTRMGKQFAEAFLGFEAIKTFIRETSEAQFAQAQLEAALKSTGGAAGRTVAQLDAMAESLQRSTIYTDDEVKRAQSLLLTFTSIRGVEFDRATAAVTDLAARLGTDLSGAALQLGRALQDPTQGLDALRRAGIIFSDAEKQQIKDLQDAGKAAQAQDLILQHLTETVGGSAKAARETFGGALAGLKNDFFDLFKASAGGTGALVTGLNALDSVLVALRPHMAVLVTAAEAVAAVFAGRWITNGIAEISSLARGFVVARAEVAAYAENALLTAQAQVALTAKEVEQAAIERAIAVERVQNAIANKVALAERAAAINVLAAADARLATANTAAAASEAELAVAVRATNAAASIGAAARGAIAAVLAPIGGPVGAAIIATLLTIKFAFDQEAKAGKDAANAVTAYGEHLAGMSAEARRAELANLQLALSLDEVKKRSLTSQINALPKAGTAEYDVNTTPQLSNALGRQLSAVIKDEDLLKAKVDLATASLKAEGGTADEVAGKFKTLHDERALEIAKLTALNDAYGKDALTLKEIELHYDALAEKQKNAEEHHGAELVTLNALTDAKERALITAAKYEQATKDGADAEQYFNEQADETLDALGTLGVQYGVLTKQIAFAKTQADLFAGVQAEVSRIGQRNQEQTAKQDAQTAEAIRKQQQYVDDVRAIWRDGFDKIITDGGKSFHDFFEDVFRLFGRLMDRMRQEGKNSPLISLGTAALGGALGGYQFGQQSRSLGSGFAGGAALGAYQGFVTAGPLGALVGGLAGAVGGLVGAADAHKQAAQALKDAATQIEQGLANYASSNSVQSALNANQSQYLQLQTAIINALKAGVSANPASKRGVTNAFQTYAEQTQQLEAERLANIKRITENFFNGIEDKLRSLNGPAGDYQNALLAVQREYADNVASAQALYQATGDLSVLTRGLADAEALRAAEEAKLKAAEAERLKQVQEGLDARQAEAEGARTVAALLRRRSQEEKELFDATQQGYTKAQLAQLRYIQGLEDEAAAKQALADANQTLAQNLAAGPKGTILDQQKADLQPLLDKQAADATDYAAAVAQLNTDILNGADAATIAADQQAVMTAHIVSAGDAAAIAAKQFADASAVMDQSASQIEQDVAGGFTTGAQGLDYLKQAFKFTGLSDSQIKALYTPFTGTPLTNEQIQTNKDVQTYFRDEAQFGVGGGASAGTSALSGGTAISNAEQPLTENTGNRMADYEAAELIELRKHTSLLSTIAGGGSVSAGFTPSATQPTIDAALLTKWFSLLPTLAPPAPAPVNPTNTGLVINLSFHVVQQPGEDSRLFVDRVVTQVEDQIRADYVNGLLKQGNPIKAA